MSETREVFLNFPTCEGDGMIRGILPNRLFAPVMKEAQDARDAGLFVASLCTTACVIEAMVCHAAERRGWGKATTKKGRQGRKRKSDFPSAWAFLKTPKGQGILQPLKKELEEFYKARTRIFHELLRREKLTDEDRDLAGKLIGLMQELEKSLFSVSVGDRPGIVNLDHPEFF